MKIIVEVIQNLYNIIKVNCLNVEITKSGLISKEIKTKRDMETFRAIKKEEMKRRRERTLLETEMPPPLMTKEWSREYKTNWEREEVDAGGRSVSFVELCRQFLPRGARASPSPRMVVVCDLPYLEPPTALRLPPDPPESTLIPIISTTSDKPKKTTKRAKKSSIGRKQRQSLHSRPMRTNLSK